MIDIKVYNAEQIGGCFTVITTSKAKIMIDYGLPLPGAKAKQEDFDWEHDTVDAVFIIIIMVTMWERYWRFLQQFRFIWEK